MIMLSEDWDSDILNQSVTRHCHKNSNGQKKSVNYVHNQKEAGTTTSLPHPLERTGKLFGGLINDVKRKLPHFKSDFLDAVNLRCLISLIFTYFSFLAPAITFAMLLSKETEGLLGVTEMIVATAVGGVIFGIFSGQPLIIIGGTGPLLVMEESIHKLSHALDIEFLPWRIWIGFWVTLLCILIVAFDLSVMVRKFTLFTEEVVAALISTAFIYESGRYLLSVFRKCYFPASNSSRPTNGNITERTTWINTTNSSATITLQVSNKFDIALPLMTLILMVGTFLVCYYLRKLRHSRYFPSRLRRLLSDFGVTLAVFIFLLFDILMEDNYTPKLSIPNNFQPTSPSKRGWVIELMGKDKKLTVLQITLAIIPASFVTIILFMETELTGVIVDREEYKLKKGSGYNLDLLIVGILVSMCSPLGLPWMCACPVHSVAHLNSLTIWNKNTIPGIRPQVTKIIEQRATNILIHVLIGVSLFLTPLLRNIPVAVLYGVFLYLGITSLSHLQLTQRLKLLFIHPKHHPDYSYIRKVKTNKIHIYTLIQLTCLLIILIVKHTHAAPSFPFFVVLMVPMRRLMTNIFSKHELDELDNVECEDVNDEHLDEYDLVHVPM